MKFCVIIPCFDHSTTVEQVARAAENHCPVIVVDDGSHPPVKAIDGVMVVHLLKNRGKGAALQAGFQHALAAGFTHAITMDADGQHSAGDLPKLVAAAEAYPDALVIGGRDLVTAGAPAGRRWSNELSNFWFAIETGVRLGDTQCGLRCYPLALTQRLNIRSGRYAFELEFMVRAAWTGTRLLAVPVACTYLPEQLRQSHFRPVADLLHITAMNAALIIQSCVVPRSLRAAWSMRDAGSTSVPPAESSHMGARG